MITVFKQTGRGLYFTNNRNLQGTETLKAKKIREIIHSAQIMDFTLTKLFENFR